MDDLILNKVTGNVVDAVVYKEQMEESVNNVIGFLNENSPSDNQWYFQCGSFRVDVEKKDYDKYMCFINNLVGCSYCHIVNSTGLTFLFSLSTLYEKLMGDTVL